MIHILSGDMVGNKADKTSYFMELTLQENNETFTPFKKKKKRYEVVSNAIYPGESRTEGGCKTWNGGMLSIVQMQLTNQVNITLTKAQILNVSTKQKQTYRYQKQTYLPKGKHKGQREV